MSLQIARISALTFFSGQIDRYYPSAQIHEQTPSLFCHGSLQSNLSTFYCSWAKARIKSELKALRFSELKSFKKFWPRDFQISDLHASRVSFVVGQGLFFTILYQKLLKHFTSNPCLFFYKFRGMIYALSFFEVNF